MKLQKMAVPLLVLLLVVCCIVLLVLDGKDSGTTTTTTAATTKEKYNAYSMDYFDTVTQITGYTETKEEFDAISKRVLDQLKEYHQLYTIYNSYKDINNLVTVNRVVDGAHQVVKVDQKIIDMLLYAKEMYAVTGGEMNVMMGSVLSIWHDYRTEGMDKPQNAELPSMDALLEAAKHTSIDSLVIDEEASTVWISDPLAKLDVGAIAKGYAVEMIARSLEAEGVTGFMLNVGGNVRTVGPKADGIAWLVGVQNPNESSDVAYLAYLRIADLAVVTSGSYQRYYMVDGETYHHIIDRETLMPAKGFLSVSLICPSSAMADCLSTALFCMSYEDGLALVESLEGTEAIWVFEDETVKTSSGFANYTTTLE